MVGQLGSVTLLVLAVAGSAAAQAVPAQTVPAMTVPVAGDRVRIRQTNGERVIGVVEVASPAGVQIRSGAVDEQVLQMIPLHSVRTIEKSLGRERRFGTNLGLAVGSLSLSLGVVGFLAQGCTTYEPQRAGDEPVTKCFLGDSKALATAGGAALGAALGAPIGILIGFTARHERWTRLSLPGSRAAQIRPVIAPRGAGIAVTW